MAAVCFAEGTWKCHSVSWSHKHTPMSQSEGASTEGNRYDSLHHILILDADIISWPSGDRDLQWHGQLIALLSESVTTSPSGRGAGIF